MSKGNPVFDSDQKTDFKSKYLYENNNFFQEMHTAPCYWCCTNIFCYDVLGKQTSGSP